jgi:hypothetical protein
MYVTDHLAEMSESGRELAVTLLVGGVIVRGIMTPVTRYEAWTTEVLSRTAREGGRDTIPGGTTHSNE